MRRIMSSVTMLLVSVLFSVVFVQISCQENKDCDPAVESCIGSTVATTPPKMVSVADIATMKTKSPLRQRKKL